MAIKLNPQMEEMLKALKAMESGMALNPATLANLKITASNEGLSKASKASKAASYGINELIESLNAAAGKPPISKKSHSPKPPPLVPLTAEDFSAAIAGPGNPIKLGVGPDDAASALRHMAAMVEQGRYQIQSVAAASEASSDEFPKHSLVINYILFDKD